MNNSPGEADKAKPIYQAALGRVGGDCVLRHMTKFDPEKFVFMAMSVTID
jgi:hypothetical protein